MQMGISGMPEPIVLRRLCDLLDWGRWEWWIVSLIQGSPHRLGLLEAHLKDRPDEDAMHGAAYFEHLDNSFEREFELSGHWGFTDVQE